MVQNTAPSLDALYKEIRVAEENYNQLVTTAEVIAQAITRNLDVFKRCLPTHSNKTGFQQLSSDGGNSFYAPLHSRDRLAVYADGQFEGAKLNFSFRHGVLRLSFLGDEKWLGGFIEKVYPFLVKQLDEHNEQQAEYFAKLRQLYAEA
ncbi:MAG TPA: hypothetical protein VLE93_03185 [Candidatus Saccharimonadales bacterium]|nr:hypothetical protein [Candidatus Saccharimonadales bacterium]